METLQRTANRGSISTGYDIDNSLKFENANSEYMARTPAGNGNLQICTLSVWLKRTELGVNRNFFTGDYGGAADPWFILGFQNDRLYFSSTAGVSGNAVVPTRLFRDTSAWYHMVFAIDTTQATAADRVKIYINGIQETVFTTTNYPALNDNLDIMAAKEQRISGYGTEFFNGYMSEFVGIDGQALDPTSFGEFDADSGIWKPIDVSGLTFGTNGFYLDFADSANLGNDASGGLDFTLNNITSADQATDTPTNNFCTLNPLMANAGPANYLPITEGGIKAVNTAAAYKIANSTFGVTSGKWYWEVKATDVNGVTAIGVTMPHYWDTDYTLGGCIYYGQTGQRYNNSSAGAFGATYTDGDIISFALDMDATPPTMEVYKNNVSQGNLMAGLSINGAGGAFLPVKEDGYFPKIVGYNANTFECNFGGYTSFSISTPASDENGYGTFEYAPPSGYYALCSKNLAEYG
jgi:hypothetical protein